MIFVVAELTVVIHLLDAVKSMKRRVGFRESSCTRSSTITFLSSRTSLHVAYIVTGRKFLSVVAMSRRSIASFAVSARPILFTMRRRAVQVRFP
jgi:hypothetical protein